jgi:hypothetical protein
MPRSRYRQTRMMAVRVCMGCICPVRVRADRPGRTTDHPLAHDLGYHPALSLSTGQVRVQEVESELPWRPLYFRDEIRRPYVDKDGPRSDARVSIAVSENPRWHPVIHCQQDASNMGVVHERPPCCSSGGDDGRRSFRSDGLHPATPCRPCPAKMSLSRFTSPEDYLRCGCLFIRYVSDHGRQVCLPCIPCILCILSFGCACLWSRWCEFTGDPRESVVAMHAEHPVLLGLPMDEYAPDMAASTAEDVCDRGRHVPVQTCWCRADTARPSVCHALVGGLCPSTARPLPPTGQWCDPGEFFSDT